MTANYAAHGVRDITFAILDDQGKLIKGEGGLSESGIYIADGNGEGFVKAATTGLDTEGTPQYANDQIKRISRSNTTPKIALAAMDLDRKATMLMLGYVENKNKAGYIKSQKKPHVAMVIHSRSLDNTVQIYEGFANTELTQDASEHDTDQGSHTDGQPAINVDALTPLDPTVFVDPNDPTHQEPYKKWFSDEENFDEAAIYKETLGGYESAGNGSTQQKQSTETLNSDN